MRLADHTMRELVEIMSKPRKKVPAPQVDTDAMSDEEFYAWLDGEDDCGLTRDEISSDDAGQKIRGEI